MVPDNYTDQDTESKGFYDPVIVQDFPLRGKKVFLNTFEAPEFALKEVEELIPRLRNPEYFNTGWRQARLPAGPRQKWARWCPCAQPRNRYGSPRSPTSSNKTR